KYSLRLRNGCRMWTVFALRRPLRRKIRRLCPCFCTSAGPRLRPKNKPNQLNYGKDLPQKIARGMNIRGCQTSKAMLTSRKFYIMIDRFISRSLGLLLGCSLVLPVLADVQTRTSAPGDNITATTNADKSMAPYHVTPGPADGKIAFVTATLL